MIWLAIINVVAIIVLLSVALYLFLTYKETNSVVEASLKKVDATFPVIAQAIPSSVATKSNLVVLGTDFSTSNLALASVYANFQNLLTISQKDYCSSGKINTTIDAVLADTAKDTKWSTFAVRVGKMIRDTIGSFPDKDLDPIIMDIKGMVVVDESKSNNEATIDMNKLKAILQSLKQAVCSEYPMIAVYGKDVWTRGAVGYNMSTPNDKLYGVLVKLDGLINQRIKMMCADSNWQMPTYQTCNDLKIGLQREANDIFVQAGKLTPAGTSNFGYYTSNFGYIVNSNICSSNIDVEKANIARYNSNMRSSVCGL